MAELLSKAYLGTSCSAIQRVQGDTHIFYQGADGAIYQLNAVGSVVAGTKYPLGHVIIPADGARTNTPIAATTWAALGGSSEIRVYFIDRNNYVRELVYNSKANFVPGLFNRKNYKSAPNSGFLYAINDGKGSVRVGFQSEDAPGCITEAEFVPGRGWSSAKLM